MAKPGEVVEVVGRRVMVRYSDGVEPFELSDGDGGIGTFAVGERVVLFEFWTIGPATYPPRGAGQMGSTDRLVHLADLTEADRNRMHAEIESVRNMRDRSKYHATMAARHPRGSSSG